MHCEIPEEDITDYIRGNVTGVNAEFIPIIEKGLQEYADSVEAKLREIKVDLKHENFVYVGGGASVMMRYGRSKGWNIILLITSDRRYYGKFRYFSFESETC